MHLNDKITFGDGILACMSRDFDIFMSKHLAGQWLLNSYKLSLNKEKGVNTLNNQRIHSQYLLGQGPVLHCGVFC